MTQFLALLITGAVSGGIYAILASGLVLTYVTSGVFDFAYGATAFAAAFVFYQLNTGLGWPIAAAFFVSVFVFAPLLGLVLDRTIYQNLAKASPVAKIVATIGVLVALPNLIELLSDWLTNTAGLHLASRNLVLFPPGIGPYPAKTWKIAAGATISSNQLAVFIAAIVVSLLLWVLIKKTSLGLRMRAAVDRRALASLRGVNPVRVSTQSTVLGSVIAGLAGVLIAPLFNLDPNQFIFLTFVAATGAVLGGLRSIPIAMLGGLFVGVAQSMVAGYVNISPTLAPGLQSGVPFVLLFVALIIIGRERGRAAGQVSEDAPPPDYLSDLSPWRRALPWVIVVIGLVVWIQFTSEFYATLTGEGIALGIVFLSFVVITGAGGMVSLAQAAFVAFGALISALLAAHGVPFLPAALVGGLAACFLGLVVALPSLRLGGLWLALSTLAAGFLADQMLFQFSWIRGGGSGRAINRPVLGPFNFNHPASYAMLLLIVFGILALGVRNLLRSPTGRLMIAIRSSEVGALTSGASIVRPKFVLFGVSAMIAGFGGTLLAANDYRVDPLNYPTTLGMVWITVMVVFGVRRIGGALIAGLMVPLFPEIIRHITSTTLLPPILFGLGAINLAQNPDGVMAIMGLKSQARRQARLKRRQQRAAVPSEPAEPEPKPESAVGAAPVLDSVPPGVPATPSSLAERGEYALEIQGVSAGYEGVTVLHDLNLSIPRGGYVVIVGANGAGKSTLCSVIAGLVTPTSGRVLFRGEDITSLAAHQRARMGLILAPEYRGIFPGLSVEDNVAVSSRDPAVQRAALARFPILTARRRQAAQVLSGGEQQMLTLAPVLEQAPDLLVVDEPSLGLSPSASHQVFASLAELHAAGTTILLVEEQARRAIEFAEDVILLDVGRVTWQGPASHVTDELARELYLGKTNVP